MNRRARDKLKRRQQAWEKLRTLRNDMSAAEFATALKRMREDLDAKSTLSRTPDDRCEKLTCLEDFDPDDGDSDYANSFHPAPDCRRDASPEF